MSINVTVTGNPVRINRGKMVTACPCKDAQKGEFEKRRLMRLEQVSTVLYVSASFSLILF